MNDKRHPPPPPPQPAAKEAPRKKPWSKPTIRNSDGVIDFASGQDARPAGEAPFYRSP